MGHGGGRITHPFTGLTIATTMLVHAFTGAQEYTLEPAFTLVPFIGATDTLLLLTGITITGTVFIAAVTLQGMSIHATGRITQDTDAV